MHAGARACVTASARLTLGSQRPIGITWSHGDGFFHEVKRRLDFVCARGVRHRLLHGRAAIASANNTHAANAIAALSPAGRNAADSRPDTMRDHGRTKTLIAIMAMVFVCLIITR